jgi:hypothetical protein
LYACYGNRDAEKVSRGRYQEKYMIEEKIGTGYIFKTDAPEISGWLFTGL